MKAIVVKPNSLTTATTSGLTAGLVPSQRGIRCRWGRATPEGPPTNNSITPSAFADTMIRCSPNSVLMCTK